MKHITTTTTTHDKAYLLMIDIKALIEEDIRNKNNINIVVGGDFYHYKNHQWQFMYRSVQTPSFVNDAKLAYEPSEIYNLITSCIGRPPVGVTYNRESSTLVVTITDYTVNANPVYAVMKPKEFGDHLQGLVNAISQTMGVNFIDSNNLTRDYFDPSIRDIIVRRCRVENGYPVGVDRYAVASGTFDSYRVGYRDPAGSAVNIVVDKDVGVNADYIRTDSLFDINKVLRATGEALVVDLENNSNRLKFIKL